MIDIKKILLLLVFAIAIVGIIAPANATVESIKKENRVYTIESQEKSTSYEITWDANGGRIGSKKSVSTRVERGSKLNRLLTSPKRSGYTFNGWYTKKSGGKKINTNTVPNKKVTYYAQWSKTYTLTFDANGGTVTPRTKNLAKNKLLSSLPTATRSGYTFNGWYTAKMGGKKVNSATKMPSKNIKLYAQWKKSNTNSNTNIESRLLGSWESGANNITLYTFEHGNRFRYVSGDPGTTVCNVVGNYKVSNGKIYFTNVVTNNNAKTPQKDKVVEFELLDFDLLINLYNEETTQKVWFNQDFQNPKLY